MAGLRDLRRWGLAVAAVCVLAATGGLLSRQQAPVAERRQSAVVAVPSAAVEVAVLPARAADVVRAAGTGVHTRAVVLAAVLAALLGLPAVLGGAVPPSGRRGQPVRARRHSIALRAPPLQSA